MINNVSSFIGGNSGISSLNIFNQVDKTGKNNSLSDIEKRFMNNLDDIKAADKDKNNIISLKELQNFDSKTNFARMITELMEGFVSKI